MPRRHSLAGVAVALLGAGLLTACGGSSDPAPAAPAPPLFSSSAPRNHVLEIEVTGTATISTLTFTLDGKTTEEKEVQPPWRRTFEVPYGTGEHTWDLTMHHSGGRLAAVGRVDGQLLTQTGGSGSPGSNNTVSLSGGFSD